MTDYKVFVKERRKWLEVDLLINASTPQKAREMAMFTYDLPAEKVKVESV